MSDHESSPELDAGDPRVNPALAVLARRPARIRARGLIGTSCVCVPLAGGPMFALDDALRVTWVSSPPVDRWVGTQAHGPTHTVAAGDGADLFLLSPLASEPVVFAGLATDSEWAFSSAGHLIVAQPVGSRIVVTQATGAGTLTPVSEWQAAPDTLPGLACFGDLVCVTECGPDDIRLSCFALSEGEARRTCDGFIPLWRSQDRLVGAGRDGLLALDLGTMTCNRHWTLPGVAPGAAPVVELGDAILLRDDEDRLLAVPRRWLGQSAPEPVIVEGRPMSATSAVATANERLWLTTEDEVLVLCARDP